MKNLKLFVCAVTAAAVLMAFVGVVSASAATELTCGESLCLGEQTIKAESEGKAVLDTPSGNLECNSIIEGHTTDAEGSPDGPINLLAWSNCGGATVTTLATGIFSVEHVSGGDGTLRSTGAKVTVINVGVHCIYETSNTPIGALTGSTATGGNATFDISATIPRVGGTGGAFCGSSARWTGSYRVTAPNPLGVNVWCRSRVTEGRFTNRADCEDTVNEEPALGTWDRFPR